MRISDWSSDVCSSDLGSTFAQRSTNYAVFTHNSFDIVEDALTLTVGARYTHEKKTLSGDANFTNTLCPAIVNSPLQALASLACVINGTAPDIVAGAPGTKFSEGQWTGTAVLSWRPAPDWLVYASASKGYKAGRSEEHTSELQSLMRSSFA